MKFQVFSLSVILCSFFTLFQDSAIYTVSSKANGTSLPPARAHHEMVYDEATQSIMMVGGVSALPGGRSYKFLNDIWRFTSGGWSKVGNSGDERSGIRMAYDTKQNKIYSLGGYSEAGSLDDFRILENNQWQVISHFTEMKAAEPGFVYDVTRGKLVAFGGSGASGQINNITWEFDGRSWTKFNGKSPEGRFGFAMVYDSKRNKTVLFGGMNSSGKIIDDGVWEFDGKEWKNYPSSVAPGSRMLCGYTYDSKRGMLIIFGGAENDGDKGDTWGWNGSSWKKLADKGPSPRIMGMMAYDKNRDRVVLFGGRIEYSDAGDTWEWDGLQWHEILNK